MRRFLVATSVVVLALASWAGLSVEREVVDAAPDVNAMLGATSTASVAWRMPATPAASRALLPSASVSETTAAAVPITVTAPRKLLVGEMNDLIVDVGTNEGVGEIGFTVQFDANVLQVRAGTEGNWTAGSGLAAQFAADISSAEDRVQIRSIVAGQRTGAAVGSVAIVQFQAVAAGSTSVIVSDVVVKDRLGRLLVSAVAGANLQMTVDSPPLPGLEAGRPPGVVAMDALAATIDD